ncbi:hypothetical protein [Kordia sp.]|uniref:hypothetical protein n=1 Tax=Kordia sp. TaxID=1965332 RepID=UPI0025BADCDC|nr:hypothetical protein [Kordia sp.]MCH2196234.1 hypothetical protein [Kordia sp.]
MMLLLIKIAGIGAGILLGITALDKLDGESNFFNDIAKKLMPFSTLIGGAVLALGLFELLGIFGFNDRHFIYDLAAMVSGLLLLTHVLSQVPKVGDSLVSISKKLMPFKVIFGVGLLVLSVLRFIYIHPLG